MIDIARNIVPCSDKQDMKSRNGSYFQPSFSTRKRQRISSDLFPNSLKNGQKPQLEESGTKLHISIVLKHFALFSQKLSVYGRVSLSLAEAMVQKGGYVYSDVTALVNEVRQRADVNMPTVEEVEGTSLSKDELLEVIKHERRVELAFEGLRLFDLYRWKELDKAVANIENERTMYGLAYEARKFNGERDYVWPLPTAELDTNKKLVQHDLWK